MGRHGRSPNPEIVRAIKKWPPVRTLKDLQAFLGTTNYARPHMGPAYSRVSAPLRALLRPNVVFPPNEEQLKAIQGLKELLLETHTLAVPDEAAAIAAANAWLSGQAATSPPYEIGADTSGYAIGWGYGPSSRTKGQADDPAVLFCSSQRLPTELASV